MANIGVVHPDLLPKGGGEMVCMNIIEALQSKHNITLFTLTNPNIQELNRYYSTTVSTDLTVRNPVGFIPHEGPIINNVSLKVRYLLYALLCRYVQQWKNKTDLFIVTKAQLPLGKNAIQYVHYPNDYTIKGTILGNSEYLFHPNYKQGTVQRQIKMRVWHELCGYDTKHFEHNKILTNSPWTATIIEHIYDVQPDVVYPPINVSEFSSQRWDDREDGFVAISRLSPEKRISDLITIIDRLREQGYNVHLHIIGPIYDKKYGERIEEMAADRDYIILEGAIPRKELISKICSHKYGLHGMQYEHFGIAVAELVAGGSLPFVPATGGPPAIVNQENRVLWTTTEEAVEKIQSVLTDPELQKEVRQSIQQSLDKFRKERFQQRFATIVDECLAEVGSGDVKTNFTYQD